MAPTPAPHNDDLIARRKRARRTAVWIAFAAVAVYVVFLLINVSSR